MMVKGRTVSRRRRGPGTTADVGGDRPGMRRTGVRCRRDEIDPPRRRPPSRGSRASCLFPRPIPGRFASGVVAWPRSRSPEGVEQGASNHDRQPEGHGRSTPFALTSTFLQSSQISRSSKPLARAPDDREDPRRSILRCASPDTTRDSRGHGRDRADLEERTRHGQPSHPRRHDRRRRPR
jgi:hypothetical protein